MGVRGYLAKYEKNIYIITGMGNLFYLQNKDILNKKELIIPNINALPLNLCVARNVPTGKPITQDISNAIEVTLNESKRISNNLLSRVKIKLIAVVIEVQ